MLRRLLAALLCVLTVVSLSGCSLSMDVETLLRPPQTTGEQREIQAALEKYISSSANTGTINAAGGYVLKYPKSGDYRSAFVLRDVDSDGEKEAIVFYSSGLESSNAHMNLLKKINSGWKSVDDVEGASPNIEAVYFSDLLGDGALEVLTGWDLDNVRDKQLVIYSVTGDKFSEKYKELYSGLVLADLTQCGHDNLLLLHAGTSGNNSSTAELWAAKKDAATKKTVLTEMGSTRLDGYIQAFTSSQIGKLSASLVGAYVDGTKASGGMVTELIYWNGNQLCSPFYNPKTNTTDFTYRSSVVACRDVDGDGTVEWPATNAPIGYKGYANNAADKIWLTKWQSWNFDAQETVGELKAVTKFSCVLNLTDGYYVRIDDSWEGKYSVSYNSSRHLLQFYSRESSYMDKEVLALRAEYTYQPISGSAAASGARGTVATNTYGTGPSSSSTELTGFTMLEQRTSVRYLVRYTKTPVFKLDMEQIQYIFTCLAE